MQRRNERFGSDHVNLTIPQGDQQQAQPALDGKLYLHDRPERSWARTPINTTLMPATRSAAATYLPAHRVVDALNFSAALHRSATGSN